MRPAEVRVEIVVRASSDAVFEAFTRWEDQGMWMLGTRVRAVDGLGIGIGSRLEAWTGWGSLGFVDPMVITRWDPPYRVDVEHCGRVVRGTGQMEVVALPGGRSRFSWTEQLELPLGAAGRIGWVAARPVARYGVLRSLRAFRRLLEAGVLARPRRSAAGADPR